MKKLYRRVIYFLKIGVWEVKTKKYPFYVRFGINAIKVAILAFKGFKKDECPIRSPALTYFTLLSIVPVVAVTFAIATGFGLEELLEKELAKTLASQKEVMTYLLDFSEKMLDTTKKSGLAIVISIGFLLYSVLRLFNHIENAVNTIWNIKKSRPFIRKFTDYLTIVIIAPILMVASSAATVYINTILKDLSKDSILEVISPFLFSLIKLFPFVIMWLLFTLMYIIMPNTKIKFSRAFIAGLIAGTAFQLIQVYYIDIQTAFSRYNAIYGSFAALPLFLIWVQFSWLVFLLGAEIASALNNISSHGYKLEFEFLSNSKKRMLSLLILKKITTQFEKGNAPPNVEQLSNDLKLPGQYISRIIENLVVAGLVNEVIGKGKKENGFQPAKDITKMSFSEAYEKLDKLGDNRIFVRDDDDYEKLNKKLEEFSKLVDDNYSQLLIKSI